MKQMAQRPQSNGSSDVITHILIGLTVLGASALSVVAALRPKTGTPEPDPRERPAKKEDAGA
jgi:hypothetical protein